MWLCLLFYLSFFFSFSFFFCYQSASDGFWKSVATRVPREPHEIRILNPYFIQEAAFSFIGLPFNNGLMGRGVGIKQSKQNQKDGWDTRQQSRLTLFLVFLWASTGGHWREETLALLWWQRLASFRPRQDPSLEHTEDFVGDHQHFSSALNTAVKLHPGLTVKEGTG